MDFKKFYIERASKDTMISSKYIENNYGKSEVLSLSKSSDEFTRMLVQFNTQNIIDFFGIDTLSNTANTISAKILLSELKDDQVYHNTDWDIEMYGLSNSWDEGFSVNGSTGYCNYLNRTKNNSWVISGGDINTSISATQHFENGYEDIEIDVSNYIVTNSLSAGVLFKFPTYIENSSTYNDIKRFYSTKSRTIFVPRLKVEVTKPTMEDNRNRVLIGTQQRLFLPYRLDSALINKFTYIEDVNDLLNIKFNIVVDNVPLTGVSYNITKIDNTTLAVDFVLNYYKPNAVYQDVWKLDINTSITGRFNAYNQSDYIGLDYQSITGNFNKNYISKSLIDDIGVIRNYNKEMHYNNIELSKCNPYDKNRRGTDNLGLLFNNDLLYPEEFYVKILDFYSDYEYTGWIKLDLMEDSYMLELDTKSFRKGSLNKFQYRIKNWNSYNVINSIDFFKII